MGGSHHLIAWNIVGRHHARMKTCRNLPVQAQHSSNCGIWAVQAPHPAYGEGPCSHHVHDALVQPTTCSCDQTCLRDSSSSTSRSCCSTQLVLQMTNRCHALLIVAVATQLFLLYVPRAQTCYNQFPRIWLCSANTRHCFAK